MTELPDITIVTTTYYPDTEEGRKRHEMAKHIIASWFGYLRYDGCISLHIADDGSQIEDAVSELEKIWNHIPLFCGNLANSNQLRKGVGASLNKGLASAFSHSPLAMYIMDDWMLEGELDITPWAELIMENVNIGIIRLGPPHPGLTGTVVKYSQGWGMIIDRHNFAYGMRPAIYHKRFFETYGWFSEGDSAVECERKFNVHFCDDNLIGPEIMLALPHPWTHQRILDLGEVEP